MLKSTDYRTTPILTFDPDKTVIDIITIFRIIRKMHKIIV
jgi:hypothetical protein